MNLNLLHFRLTIHGSLEMIQQTNEVIGPILEPDPIKFSFHTTGWYFLGSLLFLILLTVAIKLIMNYRKNAYRRQAIKQLDQLNITDAQKDIELQVTKVLAALKLVAVQTYGRKKVATLYGKPWLLFLDSKVKNKSFIAFEPIISKSVYQGIPMSENELNNFKNISKKWIHKHA